MTPPIATPAAVTRVALDDNARRVLPNTDAQGFGLLLSERKNIELPPEHEQHQHSSAYWRGGEMMSRVEIEAKLPMSQKVMAGKTFAGSAANFRSEIREVKIDPVITPAKHDCERVVLALVAPRCKQVSGGDSQEAEAERRYLNEARPAIRAECPAPRRTRACAHAQNIGRNRGLRNMP